MPRYAVHSNATRACCVLPRKIHHKYAVTSAALRKHACSLTYHGWPMVDVYAVMNLTCNQRHPLLSVDSTHHLYTASWQARQASAVPKLSTADPAPLSAVPIVNRMRTNSGMNVPLPEASASLSARIRCSRREVAVQSAARSPRNKWYASVLLNTKRSGASAPARPLRCATPLPALAALPEAPGLTAAGGAGGGCGSVDRGRC